MKKRLLNIICLFLILSIFSGFYIVNHKNYIKLKEIDREFVKHPELLPNKESVKYTSFWYSNLKSSIYWIEAIQYIWWNVIWSEYKKYLYKIIDLITELNPYFEKPYLVWQLLLPSYNERYENLTKNQQKENIKQGELIWLKWIKNFCNEKKIQLINNENDLQKIWNEEKYKNPCKTSNIPFSQAFIYYFYLKNPELSAKYYKIASANNDSLEWAKIMAAIMSWKAWNRERSIMMFLTLANSLKKDKNKEKCEIFSQELQRVSYLIYRQNIELTWEMIKKIENLRNSYFKFDAEAEKEIISWDNCDNYINKAIRELNLQYIENANKKYFDKNKQNAKNAKELFDKWFIEFLPTDFQQYGDYWIIYIYNEETKNFDYKMWNY